MVSRDREINRLAKRDVLQRAVAQFLGGVYQYTPGMREVLNEYAPQILAIYTVLSSNTEIQLGILKDAASNLADEFAIIVNKHKQDILQLETQIAETGIKIDQAKQDIEELRNDLSIHGEDIVEREQDVEVLRKPIKVPSMVMIVIGVAIIIFEVLMALDLFSSFSMITTPLENQVRAGIFIAITSTYLLLLYKANETSKGVLRFFEILISLQTIYALSAFILAKFDSILESVWFIIFVSAFPKVLLGLAILSLAVFFYKYKMKNTINTDLDADAQNSNHIIQTIKVDEDADVLEYKTLIRLISTLTDQKRSFELMLKDLKQNPPLELLKLENEQKERLDKVQEIVDHYESKKNELAVIKGKVITELDKYKAAYIHHFNKQATSVVVELAFPEIEQINSYYNLKY